jgi:multiple sugar transport system substrate-binding protein
MAPLGAQAADLVVWWEKGFYLQKDAAVAEIVAAFEQETGKQVELVLPEQDEILHKAQDAIVAGSPPDFLFGTWSEVPKWAYEDRLVDLYGVLAPVLDLFDADAIEASMLLNGSTGKRGLYALPMGRISQHVHVWERRISGASGCRCRLRRPIPTILCCSSNSLTVRLARSRPAPAIRPSRDPGRDHRGAERLHPDLAEGLHAARLDELGDHRQQQSVPCPVRGDDDEQFALDPERLKQARPDDYYNNASTIDWPNGLESQPMVIDGFLYRGVVFKQGRNPDLAGRLVNFLAEDGWLAHWLDFAGDRMLPPMRKLVEQPFWLDPTDPHRMRAAIQILERPHLMNMDVRDHERQSGPIWDENVWGKAVHRVVADGISPEQTVDDAIGRIKEILSE